MNPAQTIPYRAGMAPLQDFTVFFICSPEGPVHISLCRTRHEKARHWLQKQAGTQAVLAAPEEKEEIFSRLVEDLLADRWRTEQLPASPCILGATSLQKRVWKLLLGIPYGETRTYGNLAERLGNIGLARAVGQACGANPLALMIPCHRVVAATGPGGFSGGLAIKHYLLAREQGWRG